MIFTAVTPKQGAKTQAIVKAKPQVSIKKSQETTTPPPTDQADIGSGSSMGGKIANKALNVALGVGAGYYFGELFQGSMKATLIASAPGIVLGAAAFGIGAALLSGMIAAKAGSKHAGKTALKWGAGTALATGLLLTGAAAGGQALTNALPWTPAINGAVMGGTSALLTTGTDWSKVAARIKDKMSDDGDGDGGQEATPQTNIPKPVESNPVKAEEPKA